jgi:ATP-dependent Clp protease protease subunit
LGGVKGQASDIAIEAEEIIKTRESLYKILSDRTGKTVKQIEKDADRDKYFTAKEAKEYGLIDKVIKKR